MKQIEARDIDFARTLSLLFPFFFSYWYSHSVFILLNAIFFLQHSDRQFFFSSVALNFSNSSFLLLVVSPVSFTLVFIASRRHLALHLAHLARHSPERSNLCLCERHCSSDVHRKLEEIDVWKLLILTQLVTEKKQQVQVVIISTFMIIGSDICLPSSSRISSNI